jgi:hypothetical protein
MIETQILDDELKEVGEHNSVLINEKQELEAKLAKESRAKMLITFSTPYSRNWIMSE